MKKLLFLAKTIDGGTGTQLLNILKIESNLQNALAFSVAVLERPIYMPLTDKDFYYLKHRDYSLERYSISYKNLNVFFKELFWINKIILKEKPDIIVAMDVNCNIYTGLIKWLFRKKFKTAFITTSDLEGNLNQKSTRIINIILKKVIKFFYNRANVNICVSGELSKKMQSRFKLGDNVVTIYNGLDIIHAPEKNPRPTDKIILSIARLDMQKDHLTLLKSFQFVIKEVENALLWIVGDGPLMNELKNYVQDNNLCKNVHFFGWQNNLNEFYSKSDIFVLSSNREGLPYVLIEAMSFGIPIVSTDTPYGPREILEDGKYGFLVPMKDPIQMKEAIVELLENKEVYLKYAGLAFERSKFFTSEKTISEYANEIKKLF